MSKKKKIPKEKWKKTGPKEPVKWNAECMKKLREAFSIGCNITEACLYADITTRTFYNYCKEGTELFLDFMELREKPALKARNTIFKALDNPEDAKWYMKNKRRDEFVEKQISDIQTKGEKVEGFNFIMKKDNEGDDRSDD